MGYDPTRTVTPGARPHERSGLWKRLTGLIGLEPHGGAKQAPVARDRFQRGAAPAALRGLPIAAASAVARLAKPGAARGLDIQSWQALAAAWPRASASEQAAIATRLRAGGVTVEPSSDGRYVSFVAKPLYVTAEPASGSLRRSQSGRADCYVGSQLVKTMVTQDSQVTVSLPDGRCETWSLDTGEGRDEDGQPIVPAATPAVPGEAPRTPTAQLPANHLQEPVFKPGTSLAAYEPAYDLAITAAGDQVEQASDPSTRPADEVNCHSFATTSGQGDLFDPFLREGQPHWIENSLYQLTTGAFSQLSPTQAVHPGDIVVYKNGPAVTHSGVVKAVDADGNPTQIESKFGILGIYQHALADVPADYGQPALYFRPNPS